MSKLKKLRPRCFFDISIDGQNVGRIIFELFNETCPKTCENFKALCTGEKGIGKNTNKLLHYKNVPFHRIINGFMIQSGDFSQMNGKGGESIYGGTFNDESFHFKHDRPFLLSMANRGPNTNGSQFFITLVPTPHLDGVHVVFGHVIAGQDVVMKIAQQSVDKNSRPLLPVLISNCGELVPKIVPKDDKKTTNKHHSHKNSDQDSESSSSDDSDSDSSAEDSSNSESDNDSSGKIDKTNDSKNEDNTIESNENSISLFNPKYNVRIDPNEIPEIPKNRFLERNKPPNKDVNNNNNKEQTNDRKYSRQTSSKDRFYEKRIKYTRSGRKIKGRGSIHYRTPSPEYDDDRRHYRRQYSSRRESTYRRQRRSETPLHWRVEQAKIKTWKEIISNSRKDKSNDEDKHRSRSRSRSRSSSPKNDRKHRRDSYTRRHDHTSEHRRKHRSKSPSRSSKHSRRIDENGEDDKRRKFREYPSPEINDKITKSQFEKENNYNSTNHHHKK